MNRTKLFVAIVFLAFLAVSCKTVPGDVKTVDYQMSYTVGSVSFDMVNAPAGTYTMGISSDNRRKVTRGIAQPVALDGFVFSALPVSQALWTEVMGSNPSQVKDPEAPVDMVSWVDIQKFLKTL